MKITYWSSHRQSAPLSGISRYEEELMKHVGILRPDINMKRVQRTDNLVLGSTVSSWFTRYRKMDADIVHATDQVLAPMLYLGKPKRFIVTVHDLIPLVYPEVIENMSFRIQWLLTPKALKRVDRILANSYFTKGEIIRLLGIDSRRIDVTYPGVDHSRYFPTEKNSARYHLGLDVGFKYVLSVAPDIKHKRVDRLFAIIQEVRKHQKGVMLIRADHTKGPNHLHYSNDGVITFGQLPESDMPTLYNAADVFLHTSEYEGFGSPILEAMSCGLPVVVSNRASFPEIVGNCGSLIDTTLSNTIQRFAEGVLSQLGKGIDKDVVRQSQNFSWNKTALDTIVAYEKIL